MDWPKQCAVVIPCLNEAKSIRSLVTEVRRYLPTVIVIDDGSSDASATLAAEAGAEVIRHEQTSGKGSALKTGWRRARERGFDWALSMDGDGQHAPTDIPAFLDCAETKRASLIVGNRMSQADAMPWLRRRVNRWMSRRLSRWTGVFLPDSQCGFRLAELSVLFTLPLQTTHFEIETELLLAFVSARYPVEFVPVQVIYRNERSKIRPVSDGWRWLRWWTSILSNNRFARLQNDSRAQVKPDLGVRNPGLLGK